MMDESKELERLWRRVQELNHKYFPDNALLPILGNGELKNPKIMFVFINPTHRNISSSKDWKGPRYPFVGTKNIWNIFYKAGLFDKELLDEINACSTWDVDFSNSVLQSLKKRRLYITNIVKWTGSDATLPDAQKIKLFLPLLEEEISIVKPEYVLTFGLIPFENLTKNKIKLSEYYERSIRDGKLASYEVEINKFRTRVIPCYFPIGRGNPKRAVELLKLLKDL